VKDKAEDMGFKNEKPFSEKVSDKAEQMKPQKPLSEKISDKASEMRNKAKST